MNAEILGCPASLDHGEISLHLLFYVTERSMMFSDIKLNLLGPPPKSGVAIAWPTVSRIRNTGDAVHIEKLDRGVDIVMEPLPVARTTDEMQRYLAFELALLLILR